MSEQIKEVESTIFITVNDGLVQEIQSTDQNLNVFITAVRPFDFENGINYLISIH